MLVSGSTLVLLSLFACDPPRKSTYALPTKKLPGVATSKLAQLPIGVPDKDSNPESRRVLLVVNKASDVSIRIAEYYAAKRKIPGQNVVAISCSTSEQMMVDEYDQRILKPVKEAIRKSKGRIDFIVTTKGTPIRVRNGWGYSVDALLAAMEKMFPAIPDDLTKLPQGYNVAADIERARNPYYGATTKFNSKTFGMYLVTRLDGYELSHVKGLIDRSIAAKPAKGPFFFDEADNRRVGGYAQMQDTLGQADQALRKKGFSSLLDKTGTFQAPKDPLMGYASWGSNDGAYKKEIYQKIRFKPGALVETFVSTSGRTFNRTTAPGQSLIADLIEQGVTGVKGYVSEPWTFALANPALLFDRYTSGYNLAESFYAASPVIKWKDVVIGDPLCSPYAR